ncbi:MAG: arginine--tRNA ligase [Pirellulaceae bacterium]|nr:arginine--tRNA ligase [Pirellulaceae bacterium]
MKLTETLRDRFAQALDGWVDQPQEYAQRVAPARDPRFGDYQANIAMPLEKKLGIKALEIANQLVARLKIDDLCLPPEVLPPGFINLRLRPEVLASLVQSAVVDERLGVGQVAQRLTYVIDYSSPNVAKPMHVGHIRSTVIGDSLARILRFLGHRVISDNHLGDWGTQFGMVIYGYKHFVDAAAFEAAPVAELSRLYRLVQQLISYQAAVQSRPAALELIARATEKLSMTQERAAGNKKAEKEFKAATRAVEEAEQALIDIDKKIARVQSDPLLNQLAIQHSELETRAQGETVKLHQGDPENLALWERFMPLCLSELEQVYRRLSITFDYQYGESFYHAMLEPLVERLTAAGLAKPSDGALCIFVPGFDAPMLVRKADGAFLYATTDLATIEYRQEHFQPDVMLYVVDHRQGEHFNKLFAAARTIGYGHIDMQHIAFGTVTDKEGKPYKTREGSVMGLDYLLDEAVDRAYQVVCDPERLQRANLQMSEVEQRTVSETVGLAAIKYADLCHNRTSDYVFDLNQMVQLEGNTAAYIQYSYARIANILKNAEVSPTNAWASQIGLTLAEPAERDLALNLLQFEDALWSCLDGYYPSQLTAYLYALARQFASFYDLCPVLKADTAELRASRLLLCHATGSTLKLGLSLLGIGVVDRM